MKRVLILSDTHGPPDPRIAELSGSTDYVVHAGDLGGLCGLSGLAPDKAVIAVSGNNDVPSKWPEEEHNALLGLPAKARLELPGGVLVVEHGHRVNPAAKRHAKLRARHPEARLVVYGHSHHLLVDDSETPWVVNPGAAGRSRTFGGPSCLLLSASEDDWRIETRRFALNRNQN
ncbi:MAG: metallophosphoesterase family protein [Gammaproteobacteria bacterium]